MLDGSVVEITFMVNYGLYLGKIVNAAGGVPVVQGSKLVRRVELIEHINPRYGGTTRRGSSS